MILGIVSVAMIVVLYLCCLYEPHPNYTQNIDKNKEYIMKYQLICYAHKIKIHEIYTTCVFTLFNINYLKLSVYLTYCICIAFLQTITNIVCHFLKCKFR